MTSAQVGRVVVGVSGSLANVAALHAAAEHARLHSATLLAVLAWQPPGGELAYRRAPWPHSVPMWREGAKDKLRTVLVDAFGENPQDLTLEAIAVRGDAGRILVAITGHPDDLLVIGAGRRAGVARIRHGGVSRYCLAHARCQVLAVPPPELVSELRRGRPRLRDRDLRRLTTGADGGAIERSGTPRGPRR